MVMASNISILSINQRDAALWPHISEGGTAEETWSLERGQPTRYQDMRGSVAVDSTDTPHTFTSTFTTILDYRFIIVFLVH